MFGSVRATTVVGLASIVAFVACSESNAPDLVTITGTVRNIDTAQPAPGVRVSLLDSGYADDVATGADGAYSLKVPRGSVLYLYTDDFDPTTDVWFPFVNVDVPAVVANDNVLDFAIHSCPQTLGGTGSVDRWASHLGTYDDANEDRFVPTHPASSSGVLVVNIWLWSSATPDGWVSSEGLSVSIPDGAFPVAYLNSAKWSDPTALDFLYPSSRTTDDGSGLVLSFGDPAYPKTTLEVRISDPDMVGGRDFPSPFSVPVRPGTITMAHLVAIDGVPGYSFDELFDTAGLGGGVTFRRTERVVD